jgi:hypothetical protein
VKQTPRPGRLRKDADADLLDLNEAQAHQARLGATARPKLQIFLLDRRDKFALGPTYYQRGDSLPVHQRW